MCYCSLVLFSCDVIGSLGVCLFKYKFLFQAVNVNSIMSRDRRWRMIIVSRYQLSSSNGKMQKAATILSKKMIHYRLRRWLKVYIPPHSKIFVIWKDSKQNSLCIGDLCSLSGTLIKLYCKLLLKHVFWY